MDLFVMAAPEAAIQSHMLAIACAAMTKKAD
jgi:hypothetical protein